jgi:hypothetical protein
VVGLLGIGLVFLLAVIHHAHDTVMAMARAELVVQGGLVLAVLAAFAMAYRWIGDRSSQGEGA